MRERLPGNLQQRLRELREEHGYKSMNIVYYRRRSEVE